MFKTNIKQFSLVDWMVFNGHTPKNLSKTDLIQIITFIVYYNSGDFTAILPKKLINKVINGLIPDGSLIEGTINDYYQIACSQNIFDNYREIKSLDYFKDKKELLKFKSVHYYILLINFNIIKMKEYKYKGRIITLTLFGWYEVSLRKFDTLHGAKTYIDNQ